MCMYFNSEMTSRKRGKGCGVNYNEREWDMMRKNKLNEEQMNDHFHPFASSGIAIVRRFRLYSSFSSLGVLH